MRIYETSTTHRLEEKATQLGYRLQIRLIEPHEDGRYFVTAVQDVPVKSPFPLGFTDEEAIETLRRGTWKSGRINLF
ncbi:hypothetical protein [Aporhodopirellula aestuarii]|uniref:Uncharacterized protein n=1 Tax=Aporhodopirellula aestuarii TaxID=2950107 RepID=A0ABT0U5I1_9BACT|nr:hypothetical protein [Aporhodopirellula aestuarii]MCM2371919.1 hypothetical protein [Aporhodopirellula aestuarii]